MMSNPTLRIPSTLAVPTVFDNTCKILARGKPVRISRTASLGEGALITEIPGASSVASRGLSRKFSIAAPPMRWMSPGRLTATGTFGTEMSSSAAFTRLPTGIPSWSMIASPLLNCAPFTSHFFSVTGWPSAREPRLPTTILASVVRGLYSVGGPLTGFVPRISRLPPSVLPTCTRRLIALPFSTV